MFTAGGIAIFGSGVNMMVQAAGGGLEEEIKEGQYANRQVST